MLLYIYVSNDPVVRVTIKVVNFPWGRNRDYAEQYGRLRIGDTTQLRVANANDVTESKQDTG